MAPAWQISREEVPVLEEQAMDIMRAEFPELAKTYEPETTVEPGPDDTADCQAACWRTEGDSLRQS